MDSLGQGRAASGAWSASTWAALITILAMTFMEVLDGTIVNIAMPTIQHELGVDLASVQWLGSIYMIIMCAGLLVFGRLGDMIGKVRVFQIGVLGFTFGSLLCGVSGSFEMLFAARSVQALGGAASLANNMGIITEIFPTGRGKALGLVATFTALGAMAGPTIGGVLVTAFPWESIFWINVPVGLIAFCAGIRVLKNVRPAERHRFDAFGAVVLVPCMLLLFVGLTLLEHDFTPVVAMTLAVAAVLLVAFVLIEHRVAEPLVPMGVFRNIRFDIDLITMVLVFIALSGYNIVFPYYLQNARGMAPGLSGLIMACYPLVNAIVGPVAGSLSDRIGGERLTMVAQFVYAAGLALLSCMGLETPVPLLIAVIMCTSLGSALFQAPNNSLIMGHASKEHLGFVGSLGNLMRYLGQSLGIVVGMGVLMGAMSGAAGHTVTAYVPGHPEIFMAGMQASYRVLAMIVLVGALLSVVRDIMRRRQEAR